MVPIQKVMPPEPSKDTFTDAIKTSEMAIYSDFKAKDTTPSNSPFA